MYIISVHNNSLNSYNNYINNENFRKFINYNTRSINSSVIIDNEKWYLVENISFLTKDDNVRIKKLVKNKKGKLKVNNNNYKVEKCLIQ